ncbi:hypothetical protein [Rhodococcus erythropolis]|uniref:hypothetical protein n=1 Tax=Rhodococcus erythropolis TaxID=1833 RepID=UPI0024B75A96|nr:hypothetical protein [Rhodococcus erythropolis]MDJ0015068.1 hypothetical protein [Rhodococcus erythropolis]
MTSDHSVNEDGPAASAQSAGMDMVISAPDVFEEIRRARASEDEAYYRVASENGYAERLSNAADLLLADPEEFQPGDLVTWKPLLKNRRFPGKSLPAVVIERHPGRTTPADEATSAHFGEPADLVLGVIDGDEEFEIYHYDVRRFTRWNPGT